MAGHRRCMCSPTGSVLPHRLFLWRAIGNAGWKSAVVLPQNPDRLEKDGDHSRGGSGARVSSTHVQPTNGSFLQLLQMNSSSSNCCADQIPNFGVTLVACRRI